MSESKDKAPEEAKTEANIVKNGSKAYGYNYSSLADIAKAGIKIPKMRVKPMDGVEYIEYLDDNGEWYLGARIVVPEMRGMNAAQAYGSALTYARRYTVQMAKSVACDDDSKLEAQEPGKFQSGVRNKGNYQQTKPASRGIDMVKFKEEIRELKTDDDIRKYYANTRSRYKLTVEAQKELESICAEEISRRVEEEAFGDLPPQES